MKDETQTIPRWTEEFDPSSFDVQAVFREAMLQRKSAFKVLKALGYPVVKFISHEVPKFAAADGLIPATASSTAIDLSGDNFAESAIEEMQAAAKGTTVFLNHSYNLPEDVYGKVADCAIITREVMNPVTQETASLTCWDLQISPVGEDENPRAVRVTNMLQKSKLKLGVSVTVLVLKATKRKDGGRTIEHVFYIESSMVGIPCNQTAWAGATKSSPADNYRTFTPVNPNDPESLERFREELTDWLETDPKRGKTMSSETTETKPAAIPAEPKAIESGLFKGLYQEEVDEYINSVSFIVNRLVEALYTWKLKEADEAALDELLAEFVVAMKTAMQRDPDAEPWLVYYNLNRLAAEQLSKAGARNSSADQQLLDKMHDMLVDCGVGCSKLFGEEDDEAAKGVSSRLTSKVAELEAESKALREERDDLKAQLETAISVADEATKLLELEKATSLAAVAALERIGREPLPRAGASVS
jgi:hypothetical protein